MFPCPVPIPVPFSVVSRLQWLVHLRGMSQVDNHKSPRFMVGSIVLQLAAELKLSRVVQCTLLGVHLKSPAQKVRTEFTIHNGPRSQVPLLLGMVH